MEAIPASEPILGSPTPSPGLSPRLASIDILRALTMVLMIFVNDLGSLKNIPEWLGHVAGGVDGIGLADIVFPAFLFIVGMSLPYAIDNRRKKGDTDTQIIGHVLMRTIALLTMGIFLVNGETYNADDLLKWINVLKTDGFLTNMEKVKMLMPNLSDYAYGWWVQKKFNRIIQWHRGTVSGFVASLSTFPLSDLSIIVLSNVNRMPVKSIATELAAMAFGETYEFPAKHVEMEMDTSQLDSYLGKYSRSDNPADVFLLVRSGKKMLVQGASSNYGFEIFPESKDRFFAKWGEYYLHFNKENNGKVKDISVRYEGDMIRWNKEP